MNLNSRLIGVVQFPGSNCDQDALWVLRELGLRSEYVWHKQTDLDGYDGLFLPGGFSFGDYLRAGATAATSPVVDSLKEYVLTGKPVIGVCNGFQILCEAGILPGALMTNSEGKFICKDVWLTPINWKSRWTKGLTGPIRIPIAHGEGRFVDPDGIVDGDWNRRAAFQYCESDGTVTPNSAPNGSEMAIAGVLNEAGNVLGMMPHPERGVKPRLIDPLCAQILRNGFAA
ncbi:MAG: phosphoribosylformylglycinamidine synthase I [Patescibacteria group bacterium]